MLPTGVSAGAHGIRYVNVGTAYNDAGTPTNLDLELTNRTAYTPYDASLNVLINGRFAQVNLACNSAVLLRVTIKRSCSTGSSCVLCDALDASASTSCYAAGCACFGITATHASNCTGANKVAARASYSCAGMNESFVLPGGAMVSMTVFDFDTGPNGNYIESFTMSEFDYYKTPLRAASGASVSTTVTREGNRFIANARGDASDNPTDPLSLTDDQASRGVQFFIRSEDAIVEGTFAVESTLPGCTGRNLLFAGDSALCTPPPPLPPLPPPPRCERRRRQRGGKRQLDTTQRDGGQSDGRVRMRRQTDRHL